MYHQQSQQGSPQPFSNRPPRPSQQQQQQQQPNQQQQQTRSATDILSQVLGFQFPPPTQLPDELESALAIRGSRDMDHRLMDHMSQPNQQHQNQHCSEPRGYSNSPAGFTPENQPGHQQGVDWSNYQQASKNFAGPPSSATHQSQRHQLPATQQQPQSMQSWPSGSPSPQAPGSQSGGNGGRGEGGTGGGLDIQGLYTPESAGSILASFGLSNEDLEVLSHYPDDQLTPDTLPFILRDIQINKSRSAQGMLPPPSRSSPVRMGRSGSPNVPSLLRVTQTAGKVIDYGHASRATEESGGRETFKREQLSGERSVKMVYSSSSPPAAPKRKPETQERRHVRLEPAESNKHGDLDYRRPSSNTRKAKRLPAREFLSTPSKYRRLDRDYRRDGQETRPSSETRSETLSSRQPLSSSSSSKPQSSSKRFPTPIMKSDFMAEPPKVYPYTCSLCQVQCDQAEDWKDHVNTVCHTAACRDLRNKYPNWQPDIPRKDRDGSRATWRPKGPTGSRSLSWSPSPSPGKHRPGPPHHRPHGKPYTPHRPHGRPQRHQDDGYYYEPRGSGTHSPSPPRPSGSHRPDRRSGDSPGGSSRRAPKRPHADSVKRPIGGSHHLAPGSKLGPGSKAGGPKAPAKTGTKLKPKATVNKDTDALAKGPPAKKKSFRNRSNVVYLTGIPADATEQEISELVGSFGKISNVTLMPGSTEEEKGVAVPGQKASVCMTKAEEALAVAQCTTLCIREQRITAAVSAKVLWRVTVRKKPVGVTSFPDVNTGKPSETKKPAICKGKPLPKASKEPQKGLVLISGLPESGWSEDDIISLAQPFGDPCDVIMAKDVGKLLLWLPDVEMAEEMVKVHTFIPVKMAGSELKMSILRQAVTLKTPVAMYNLLRGPLDPLEVHPPIGWSSLLVISNVPATPTGPTEVVKLVQRFGAMRNTLVLSNNMIICEMETGAIALSVLKRFHKFPCIIQNNPLSFTRKPDVKQGLQNKAVFHAPKQSSPANGEGSQKKLAEVKPASEGGVSEVKPASEEGVPEVKPASEGGVPEVKPASEEGMPEVNPASEGGLSEVKPASEGGVSEVKPASEGEVSEVKPASDEGAPEVKPASEEGAPEVKSASEEGAPEVKDGEQASADILTTDTQEKMAVNEASAPENETEKVESEGKLPDPVCAQDLQRSTEEAKAEEMQVANSCETPPNMKESKAPGSETADTLSPELPKVTPAMVVALLEECRTRTLSRQGQTEDKEPQAVAQAGGTGPKEGQGGVKPKDKPAAEKKRPEKEPKERDARRGKERERKERERREGERRYRERLDREWEREERWRRERERDWRLEDEPERRDRERWRAHREDSSGSKSSGISEGSRRSARRDGSERSTVAGKAKKVVEEEEEEEFDSFPFDLDNFVTVDEVGDVTDLLPSPPPPDTMVTAEEAAVLEENAAETAEDTSNATMNDTAEGTSAPVTAETATVATVPAQTKIQGPDSEPAPPVDSEPQESTPVVAPTTDGSCHQAPTSSASPTANPASPQATMTTASGPEADSTPGQMAVPDDIQATSTPVLISEEGMSDSSTVAQSFPIPGPATTQVADLCSTPTPSSTPAIALDKQTEEENDTPASALDEQAEEEKDKQSSHQAQQGDAPIVSETSEFQGQTQGEAGRDELPSNPVAVKPQASEDHERGEDKCIKKTSPGDDSLLPFDPNSPVGMEFLIPKTGFFCKVCNRFFTGNQEAEISHCKTLKHYENLQKFLQSRKTAKAPGKP